MVKLLALVFLLSGCKGTLLSNDKSEYYKDQAPFSAPKEANVSMMTFGPFETNYTVHGGIDLYEEDDNLYVASLSKVMDVHMGGYRYHLTYGYKDKKSDKFNYKILINSINSFYQSRGTGDRNFIRITKKYNTVHIFYLDDDYNLMHLSSDDDFKVHTRITGAITFDIAQDQNRDIYIATLSGGRYSEVHLYLTKLGEATEKVGHMSILRYYNSSINLSFVENSPVISTKLKNNTEKTNQMHVFFKKDDWKAMLIANGVNVETYFNQYAQGNKLISCYQNILNESFVFELEFVKEGEDLTHRPVGLTSYDISCAVTKQSHASFFNFENSWKGAFGLYLYSQDQENFYQMDFPERVAVYEMKLFNDHTWLVGHSTVLRKMVIMRME